jgi:phospho-N-acetylmuramoyl-pentapeptide-transferase
MLLALLDFLKDRALPLGDAAIFRYLTFRSAMALMLAFLAALLTGPRLIRFLREKKAGQQIRDDRGENAISLADMHASKKNTPTGGGILIAAGLFLSGLLFADLSNRLVWLTLAATLGFALIGFGDDWLKISRRNPKGLSARAKLVFQTAIGLGVGSFLYWAGPEAVYYRIDQAGDPYATRGMSFLALPFAKNFYPDLGPLYIFFAAFVLVAFSNAVNLTDGLDGLAIGVSIIAALAFGVVTYLAGRPDFARYLLIPHIPGSGETLILVAAVIGAGMGFLWHNAHPAQVFMGDTGSLMLGGFFGMIALITKSELLLIIIGGVFVAETASVVLQVGSFKLRGRRIFKMAPIHHHFERCGWKEPQIIARFYIVAALLALFGLSTLKMR